MSVNSRLKATYIIGQRKAFHGACGNGAHAFNGACGNNQTIIRLV